MGNAGGAPTASLSTFSASLGLGVGPRTRRRLETLGLGGYAVPRPVGIPRAVPDSLSYSSLAFDIEAFRRSADPESHLCLGIRHFHTLRCQPWCNHSANAERIFSHFRLINLLANDSDCSAVIDAPDTSTPRAQTSNLCGKMRSSVSECSNSQDNSVRGHSLPIGTHKTSPSFPLSKQHAQLVAAPRNGMHP